MDRLGCLKPTHAIVVGGSVGGLAVAAAALLHFDRVTIFEKDDLLSGKVAKESPFDTKKRRRGVPQYIEPHAFTAGARQALEALVPGLTEELLARGAHTCEMGIGSYTNHSGHAFIKAGTGVDLVMASRRLINETLQDLVIAQAGDKLVLRDRTAVTGLIWDGSAAEKNLSVRGVVVGDAGEEVEADVVLWVGGRQSQLTLPKWLEAAGVPPPPRVKVDAKSVYAARWMKLPPNYDPNAEFYTCAVHGNHEQQRHALAIMVEGGMVQITLLGCGGERPPIDHEGWMEYARSLVDPAIYNFAKRCEPVGPITRFASAPNSALHYHKIKLPEGLMILGDSAQISNPMFGQGMALAAKSAQALNAELTAAKVRERGAAAARAAGPTVQRRAYNATRGEWDFCAVSDMRYSETQVVGLPRPPGFVYAVADLVAASCAEDVKTAEALHRILQNLDPPHTLAFHVPRLVAREALRMLTRWWRGDSVGKPATAASPTSTAVASVL